MEYLIAGIVFFIMFSILILIHEAGHFWAARMGGIKVEEFGFGLPPRMFGKKSKKSGVIFSVNWIPFGGFVRMLGEDDTKDIKDKDAFGNRPLWARIMTVVAGVFMNFLLAFVLLVTSYMIGFEPIIISEAGLHRAEERDVLSFGKEEYVFIGMIDDSIVNENNGTIKIDDKVLSIQASTLVNNKYEALGEKIKVSSRNDIAKLIASVQDMDHVFLEIERKGEVHNFLIKLNEDRMIGVNLAMVPDRFISKQGFFSSVAYSGADIFYISIETVEKFGEAMGKIFLQFTIPKEISGPAGIADVTHKFVTFGNLEKIIKLMIMISISLGVMNILPIPALDGGRLVFLLYEGVTRRKVNQKMEAYLHMIFFVLLLILIFAVTYKDIKRIFFE